MTEKAHSKTASSLSTHEAGLGSDRKQKRSTTRNEDRNYEKVDKKSGEETRMELFGT